MKKHKLLLTVMLVAIVVGVLLLKALPAAAPSPDNKTAQPVPTAAKPVKGFDKNKLSHTDPNSLWVVVNKQHPLVPKDYVPPDLVVPNIPVRVPGNESMQVRQAMATALETMFAAAKEQGLNLMLSSGYRSYTYQVNLYNGYVATQGQATADTQSARPGFSEHQTGLGADLEPASKTCEVEQCFSATPEGVWLANNAYQFGFIIRYTLDDQATTGYEFEPWHVRYVGTDLSTELHNTHIATLEQFFNISGGKDY
jgi:D-alanyl-D-alanine carboxypeptidase